MKATEAQLLKMLRDASQFDIPIYQRTYSWTEAQCRQLWDDILRAGADDAIGVHFVGSIVYLESAQSQVTHQAPLHVIDGQQRITTVMLLIAALAEALGDTEPVDGFSARKLRNYYLLNPEEEGDRRFKLLLTQTDRQSFIAIVKGDDQPSSHSIRIARNFELFRKLIAEARDDIKVVCRGLAKLFVVDVALTRGQDNPQLIFESMNSTGLALSQADLIRNFILMGLPQPQQTDLYTRYWRPIEVDFGQESYGEYFDSFMRDYLTVKAGEIPRKDKVYEAFKTRWLSQEVADAGVEAMVRDLRDYSGYYRAIALGAEPDPDLKDAFADLRALKVEVAIPFLLEVYGDYKQGLLSREDLLAIVRLVESYVFRRAVCAIPTNSMNKTFPTLSRSVDKADYLRSTQAALLTLPSYRRFPRDDEFRRELIIRDMYNFRRGSYWLRRLENADRKERVRVDDYTIEHILPQNPALSAAWQRDLGPDWRGVQDKWLHTLGNLTLTGYNSEYSDRSFTEKRDMPKGLKESPLRLNKGLGQIDRWDESEIQRRAAALAADAVCVWTFPDLPSEMLRALQPRPSKRARYSIYDHPNLADGPVRELFDGLSREVLALDPCVTQVYLKVWVTFKAETNFVDVVPLAKQLRLILNMTYPEINDPRGLCRDVTNLGKWGSGDVEIRLSTLDGLPYVMGLIRQALDRQLTG